MAGGFAITLIVLVILIAMSYLLKKGWGGGLFNSLFRGGAEIIFRGGKGEHCECIRWEKNDSTGLYMLSLLFTENDMDKKTGFLFKGTDFDPNPDEVDWQVYEGRIICYKSPDGMKDYKPLPLILKDRKIETLREQQLGEMREGKALISTLNAKRLPDNEKKEVIKNAKKLEAIKRIAGHPTVEGGERVEDYGMIK